jgi:peptidyl-prolyl cis-trans isomerase D
MLRAFRGKTIQFLVKGLIVIIILSFALWGIGDIFRAGGSDTVASVGKERITHTELEGAWQQAANNLKTQLGGEVPEGLKGMIQSQLMEQLVNEKLLHQETARLGLRVSTTQVAEEAKRVPAFQNEKGQFDAAKFTQLLKQNGMNEASYVARMQGDLAIQALQDAILAGIEVPDVLTEKLVAYQQEQRKIDLVRIPIEVVTNVPTPDAKAVEAFYKARPDTFRTTETRTLSYIVIGPEQVQDSIRLTPEELQTAYEEYLPELASSETRTLEQLLVEDATKANAIATALRAGKKLSEIPEAAGLAFESLGATAKTQLPKEAADAVFAAKPQSVVGPIASDFGHHLFFVASASAAKTPSFEEAKPQLETLLRRDKAQDALYQLTTQLEDAIAAKTSLAELAKLAGVKVATLGPITPDGMQANQTPATGIAEQAAFLRYGFELKQGETSPLTEAEGRYFIVQPTQVTASRVQPLAEVREQAERLAMEQARRTQQQTISEAVATALKTGKPLPHAAALKHYAGVVIDRNATLAKPVAGLEGLPLPLAAAAYQLTPGGTTPAIDGEDSSYLIASLREVIAPTITKEAQESLASSLTDEWRDTGIRAYLSNLRQRYPVQVAFTPDAPAAPQP